MDEQMVLRLEPEWKDLAEIGFPGYRVSTDGVIQSRLVKGRKPKLVFSDSDPWHTMSVSPMKTGGYMQISLRTAPNVFLKTKVHLIVLAAFVGQCPEGMECRHLDGDPTNNRLSNLRWGTPEENTLDRIKHGKNRGDNSGSAKLSSSDVVLIRELASNRVENGLTYADIADRFGVSRASVGLICSGMTWTDSSGPRTKFEKHGENHVQAKLTLESVEQIRIMIHRGGRHASVFRAIAEKYGVSWRTVSNIAYNHRWRDPNGGRT